MKFRTRAIHVGNEKDAATGAVVPPLHLASTFIQPGAGEWGEFDYSRSGNPTRKNVETTIASLESGTHALAFASGMAATHAVTMLLETGDHILAGCDIYGGTYRLCSKIFARFGVEFSFVDTADPAIVREAVRANTKLIVTETPGNPTMKLTDIQAVSDIARELGILHAVEAQALNLFGTELVVLSACDTGQGAIDYSEGLEGLHRPPR